MDRRMMKCSYIYTVLILILSYYATFTTSTSSPINVSLGFLSPLDKSLGPLSVLGHELESAFKLAVDMVNKDAKEIWIRSDFSVSVRDETADPNVACKQAASFYDNDERFVGIVGAYSSKCSDVVQEELRTLGSLLPQISYRSPSIKFLDKSVYPSFFRTTSNNKEQAQVVVDVIKHFRWSQAAIIHTDDIHYGKELSDEIKSKLRNSGIAIKEKVSFSSTDSLLKIDEILQVVKTSGSRINILVAQGKDVFTILKRIKAKDMYGEGWVWLCTDGAASLYLGADQTVNETADGLVAIAPEMFRGAKYVKMIINWYNTNDKERYPGRVWRGGSNPGVSPYVGQVYRAVSAYHTLLTQMAKDGNITARSTGSEIRKVLLNKLKMAKDRASEINPITLGLPLYFDKQTEDKPRFTILNYIKGKFNQVGFWDGGENPKLALPAASITWPGGSSQTPTDKGRPGKALFRIGFVAPIHPSLGALATYGKELVSAFKVAVDIINSDPRAYQVELDGIVKDEGFDGIASCHKAAEQMDQLNLVGVVGAYRSECSMQIHDVLGTESKKMPIISYASTSKSLSNKTMYKYFFRVVPSNDHESEILRQIVRKYGFKEVSTLYSSELASKEIAEDFEHLVKSDTVTITKSKEFKQNSHVDDLRTYVEEIRQTGSRVILVSALQKDATVLQQIIKELSMAGKGYIWLGSDGATTNHFQSNSVVAKSLEGMLGVNPKNGDGALYLKLLSSWMEKDTLQYPGVVHTGPGEPSLPYTAQVFDAVNGIAMALSDLVSRKLISHKSDTLTVRNLLYAKLKTYNSPDNGYLSATGMAPAKMYFDHQQNGPLSYNIVNLLDAKWKNIGSYKETKLIEFTTDPLFPGGNTIPIVGAGKLRYQVAAFVPKNVRLGAFSELGHIWETALKAAVSWVNRNDTLTVGFDLTVYDSGIHTSNCANLSKKLPSNIDMIIAPARSECTARLYDAVHLRGIPVFTYASTSSVLSKKTLYPNLFRLCPSDTHQALALSDLIEKYLWEKIGIVASKGIYGEELSADIENSLKRKAIQVTATESFPEDASRMKEEMNRLKRAGSGVNLIIANPNHAIQLYQEAFELGMVGKGWTWLGSDGAISTSFRRAQNLQRAMQGMVGFRPKTGEGKTFDALYNEWIKISDEKNRHLPYLAQVFDSILLPAISLHKLHEAKTITAKISKVAARRHLLNELKSMQSASKGFDSSTGKKLYFNAHQDVIPSYDLVNLNGDDWVPVGSFENGQLDITSSIVWPGGTVTIPPSNQPKPDKEVTKEENSGGTSQGLIVLAVVFSLFGLLVIIFMIYIVRRVRYRHLYMQSDLNQGGVFSVLYGHTVNRPGVNLLQQTSVNGHLKGDPELNDPMMPRHV